jgi:tartrate-resistant acid phosphatase type 5
MKIYLLGDVGEFNKETNKIFKNIKNDKTNEDIIILLGDNFYPNGVESINDKKWNNYKNLNLDIPIWCILGNHDYLGNVKAQIEFKTNNWNLPNYYYKKSFDKFDFFFIDTSILVPNYSNLNYSIVKSKIDREPLEMAKEMVEWLDRELEESTNPKIILGHYPIFSFGMYGINKKLFKILFPILKKHRIKYYISGHDHNLQIIDISTNNYSMQQIVSGAGSHLYPLLKNVSNKIFCKLGCVVINTTNNHIEIRDSNLNTIYKETILT